MVPPRQCPGIAPCPSAGTPGCRRSEGRREQATSNKPLRWCCLSPELLCRKAGPLGAARLPVGAAGASGAFPWQATGWRPEQGVVAGTELRHRGLCPPLRDTGLCRGKSERPWIRFLFLQENIDSVKQTEKAIPGKKWAEEEKLWRQRRALGAWACGGDGGRLGQGEGRREREEGNGRRC